MTAKHQHLHAVTPDTHDAPDAWHMHAAEEKPQHAHAEVANARLIIGVGVVLFAIVVFTVVAVYGYYTWYTARLLGQQESAGLEATALKRRAAAGADAGTYTWVPPDGALVAPGTVALPLERATAKVAAEYLAPRERASK